MADLEDVRLIGLTLPDTTCDEIGGGGQPVGVGVRSGSKVRGIAWVWNERIDPKKPRVPNLSVIAVRTANLDVKEGLIASDPDKYFTEPHYNGFPAVLVRLANIGVDELEELLIEGWRCLAPKALVKEFDKEREQSAPQ
jgi:hypothetical protein